MTTAPAQPATRPDRTLAPYNAPQLRMDTWNDLQLRCAWLKEFAQHGKDTTEPRAAVARCLTLLGQLEFYWAFPGPERIEAIHDMFERGEHAALAGEVAALARLLIGDTYRCSQATRDIPGARASRDGRSAARDPSRDRPRHSETGAPLLALADKPYFEVLVVDGDDAYDSDELRDGLRACRRDSDDFVYDIVSVPSLEDAIIACLFNWTIQSVFLRYNYAFHSNHKHPALQRYLSILEWEKLPVSFGVERSAALARLLKSIRPELDLFLVTDSPLDNVAGNVGSGFRRVFYRLEQYMEQHLSILKGVRERFEAPFFDALRRYSAKPTGVFHALPIARGKSMSTAHWARDLLAFYGQNIFMAETSATSGGLDSLLQPRGPIKKAQDAAARAFGARQTFFVTNGTSTANKIVSQALVRPGDIVLIDRECHKSHHYALVLAGAMPVYLDAYALPQYSMYGAVPLEEIERQLLALKAAGKLDRVRMLILTNCTFDGITYDPERVMRRVLAIKPDMIFLWDEAWFAFARFNPTLRRRTGMDAAARLRATLRSPAYREAWERSRASGTTAPASADGQPSAPPQSEAMPDPDRARIRVYVTQSTHKTLTSLRQGSMIHVYDEDFEQRAAEPFNEAFMTHTSTSPNYQIVASLDVGRRQVELEGYELTEQAIGLAMTLRRRVREHDDLKRCFGVMRPAEMIPAEFRPSGIEFYFDPVRGWGPMDQAWHRDEFTLDPTRVTLHIGATGMDGDAFRHVLMDRFDIQINKTSRNTALFMPNIGTTRGDIAYLVEVLASISRDVTERLSLESQAGRERHHARVESLRNGPPLPHFSRFHPAFQPDASKKTPTREGDLRRAYFLTYDEHNVRGAMISRDTLDAVRKGPELVSASFVIPYPPGFPVLVPGQVVSPEILEYLLALDVKEIHGYHPVNGFRVFTPDALDRAANSRTHAD
ncbi:MAG: aminotransferase class I/II-fold pyridoxal phosphate-dependent enzyme [Phycisphaeraceae bacterium]|nr:aminotransferase class I/II-fold pyridoxal phosphate-dependent enzyme [Phycisphaeraceae bacterium]